MFRISVNSYIMTFNLSSETQSFHNYNQCCGGHCGESLGHACFSSDKFLDMDLFGVAYFQTGCPESWWGSFPQSFRAPV
jgi:hypothetical protein